MKMIYIQVSKLVHNNNVIPQPQAFKMLRFDIFQAKYKFERDFSQLYSLDNLFIY